MKEARITTAALDAGNTLVLEKPEVLQLAESAGIQVFGF
jgi:DUF1009 family protein